MKNFRILSYNNSDVLFEGRFASFTECIERAVAQKISLAWANLRNTNLTNAILDDGLLPGADFTGANLSGANMSEASLRGANFDGTALYNTCFAWSDMRECNFENASFGATDIAGCDISRASFSSLSCFTLGFAHTRAMNDCIFKNPDGELNPMSRPPIVISGLSPLPVILMDRHMRSGHKSIDTRALLTLLKSHLQIDYRRAMT